MAHANSENRADEKKRADGYGIARFSKKTRKITFECWPRFYDVTQGDKVQYLGWPIKTDQDANDGRKIVGWLPELRFAKGVNPVIQVIDGAKGEVLYSARAKRNSFKPRVYSKGKHSVKIGLQKPDTKRLSGLMPKAKNTGDYRAVQI
ncbi:MAG: hypothetical protein CMO72_05615 [Verrucomicrobiales bacterium]|nr:hypothetical protein [Verrucomicrobiales bacterium]